VTANRAAPSGPGGTRPDLLDDSRPGGSGAGLGFDEVARLVRGFVDDVATGRGRVVWIEGGPETGKTELLTLALAAAETWGCGRAGSNARQPGPRRRLNPILECLGLDPHSSDLRRALNSLPPQPVPIQRPGLPHSGGAAAERLLFMFTQLCAAAPLVVAIDDLHLADPASLRFWSRLAGQTERLPLLMLATARPGAMRRVGTTLTLAPPVRA
jgi:hypothetical protein